MTIPRVLSIAGTDPTGGAGVPADLKAIAANGGYGMAVIAAVVSQNTCGVTGIHQVPEDAIRSQLDAVADDVQIDAVKIGMLGTAEVMTTVGEWLVQTMPPVVVLDPVMVATSGHRLIDGDAVTALLALLGEVALITPNVPELVALHTAVIGADVAGDLDGRNRAETTPERLQQMAVELADRCGCRVLAKGGHLADAERSVDVLVTPTGGEVTVFDGPRVATRNTHGTGCSLSAALATVYPQVGDWVQAVRWAKAWLTESLQGSDDLQVGCGHGPVHHFAGLWRRGSTRPDESAIIVS